MTIYGKDKAWLEGLFPSIKHRVKFLRAGLETGDQEEHEHLQCWMQLVSPMRLAAAKALFGDANPHMEVMKGSVEQNEDYCSKQDSEPLALGTVPKQGQRSDLEAVQTAVKEGASEKDLWEDHFPVMIKYDQAVKRYRRAIAQPRSPDEAPKINILIGPSGCGKSSKCPTVSDGAYWHPLDGKWWDGYEGQKIVVFDEFYGQYPYSQMLRILDRYPLTVELKGSTANLSATEFWFTSNQHWEQWWMKGQDSGLDLKAFKRRVEEFGTVTIFSDDGSN